MMTSPIAFYEDMEVQGDFIAVTSDEERLMRNIEFRLQLVPMEEAVTSQGGRLPVTSEGERPPVTSQEGALRLVALPRHVRLLAGRHVTFTCHVAGGADTEICWFKDGVPIITTTPTTTTTSTTSTTTLLSSSATGCVIESQLSLRSVAVGDSGSYSALARHGAERVCTSAKLLVVMEMEPPIRRGCVRGEEQQESKFFPPNFTQRPSPTITVTEGAVARLDVRVCGLPRPDLTWLRLSVPDPPTPGAVGCVVGGEGGGCVSPLRSVVSERSGLHSLLAAPCERSHSGTFVCVAANAAGTASTRLQLRVLPRPVLTAPEFAERLVSVAVRSGERAEFRARVTGTPRPSVVVRKDNQPLRGERVRVMVSDGGELTIVVSDVVVSDAGWFTASAINSAGSALSTARLDVVEPRPLYHVVSPGHAPRLAAPPPTSPYAALSKLGLDVRATFGRRSANFGATFGSVPLVESEEL